jgi:predicted metal-dependent hydrolase
MTITILAFIDDLFLLPRLEDVVRSSGYALELVEKPQDLGIDEVQVERAIPLTEPLEGADAIMVRRISAMRPALILIDANVISLPWARWIQVLKTSAATRRIPILVFGPHVETESLDHARQAGADAVVTRGTFHKRMAALLSQYSLPDRTTALAQACHGTLSAKALLGIQQHNQGEFFQAHELLEEAWMEASEHEGYLYRALLQFTVAYLHLQRGNRRGAEKLMLRIHQWLDPLPEACCGVDVTALKTAAGELRTTLTNDPTSLSPDDLHPGQIQLLS